MATKQGEGSGPGFTVSDDASSRDEAGRDGLAKIDFSTFVLSFATTVLVNLGLNDHPEFNALYEQTRYMENGPERFALFTKMAQIMKDEPITAAKLVATGKGGVLAAILPKGKRAVAVEVRAVNTAGGFILPNDRVDVILTRQARRGSSGESHVSETILENIRILAIDHRTGVPKWEVADGIFGTWLGYSQQFDLLLQAGAQA